MDYGTGHETSFALFLLCLTLVRFYESDPECEREVVLTLFVRYLRLCWRLQDVYNLEPAGSHGVWGLDDYSFLGYIFGSAQLRGGYLVIAQISWIACADRRPRPVRDTSGRHPATVATADELILSLNLSYPSSQTWALSRAFFSVAQHS